jgi:hypothetical protein
MTKIEAWIKWCDAIPMDGTEYMLEKSSHGKAFSYAWDAAVEAEREACAKLCEDGPLPKESTTFTHIPTLVGCAAAIRARGKSK